MMFLKLLGNLIEKSRERKKKIILLIGAKASIESGNPQTDNFIDEIVKDYKEELQIKTTNRYEAFYETLCCLERDQRYLILSDLFEKQEPSEGYYLLSELVKRGYFDVIITSNFDDLLEISFTNQKLSPGRHYSVFVVGVDKEEELKSFIRKITPQTKVLKIFGDIGKGCISISSEEKFRLIEKIKEKLCDTCEETILIVGVGKMDENLIGLIKQEGEPIWWVNPEELDWNCKHDRLFIQLLLNRKSEKNVFCGTDAQFDNFFSSLYECLTGGELPKRTVLGSWDYLHDLSNQQISRFLEYAKSTLGGMKYIPSVYCHRTKIKEEIENFLKSDKTGLILIGDSGVGKTNLLGYLAENLCNSGNLVFLYNCAGSLSLDVEMEIKRDLFLTQELLNYSLFENINKKAVAEDKYFIILFDAINEFRYENDIRTADLLSNIDNLISHCRFSRIKFILSCRTSTWEQLMLLGYTELDWKSYYSPNLKKFFVLERFTIEEFEHTYPLYQKEFKLKSDLIHLSEKTKERCKDPLLLRMTAEVYKNKDDLISKDAPSITVFKDYYAIKVRKPPFADEMFLEDLVAEMETNETDSLYVEYLQRHVSLGKHVTESLECAYQRLKDVGVLMEIPGNEYEGDLVKFTYDRVFEYTLARHFLKQEKVNQKVNYKFIENLIKRSSKYPSLWGTARTILLLKNDEKLFLSLANSKNYATRELIVDTLTALYEDMNKHTLGILKKILKGESEDMKRVALKAAYNVGENAMEIFLEGGNDKSEQTRRVVADYVYLMWKRDREFGYAFLDEIILKLDIFSFPLLFNLCHTGIDFSVKIIMNYLDKMDIIERISNIGYQANTKLRLTKSASKGRIEKSIYSLRDKLFQQIGSRITAKSIVQPMLFSEFVSSQEFFNSKEQRENLRLILPFLHDIDSDIEPIIENLEAMLNSSLIFPNTVAAGLIAMHTIKVPEKTIPLIKKMFDETKSGIVRLWTIFSFFLPFSYYLPKDFIQFLENLTDKFVSENRDTFLRDPWNLFSVFDTILAPLGITYCKNGIDELPLLRKLLKEAYSNSDNEIFNRLITGLAPIGFYYPNPILNLLEQAADLKDNNIESSLVKVLSSIKIAYPTEIERFLIKNCATDNLKKNISLNIDSDLISRYFNWIGLYSGWVFMYLQYPRSRDFFHNVVFEDILNFANADEYTRMVATKGIDLLQKNDFRLARAFGEIQS